MDHFKTVFAVTFFFAILGAALGPLFGFQQIISQKQECYTHTEYDNTFSYGCAGLGLALGLVLVYQEVRRNKGKKTDDDAKRDQSED
jgi:hypothetical protein